VHISNVLISDSWGDVTPEALERGIGGREGALIYLSREWAREGHSVTNFVNVGKGQRFYEQGYPYPPIDESKLKEMGIKNPPTHPPFWENGFHEYVPLNLAKPHLANFPYDVVIAWECPTVFEDEQIRDNIGLKMCEMQVAHLFDSEREAAEKYIDFMAVLSNWHGEFIQSSGLTLKKEKYVTLPNGVDINRYPKDQFNKKLTKGIEKAPKFVYSSSPDRGLWYLLQMWPLLRKEFPEAELLICYGVKKWTEHLKWSHGRIGEMAIEIERLIVQPGIKDLGKIGQGELSRLQMEADAWLYPLDSQSSTETGCISAIENAAAGNPIFATDCDCMEDEFGHIGQIIDLPFDAQEFTNKVVGVLSDQEYVEYIRESGREFAEERDWRIIAKKWLNLFRKEELNATTT
jgi:glycosyltransferase involved in cell wall biosynthesis